jgi:thymidylate synthase (FAD)
MNDEYVQRVGHMGSDMMVADAARVSFDKASDNYSEEQNRKLIMYLARHEHWTPFAHPHICFRIKAPVFIRTQMFKHKIGFVENEISRRYVRTEPEFWLPEYWRGAPKDGAKQGSSDERLQVKEHTKRMVSQAHMEYLGLLDSGVAPEHARMVLPQCMMTEWYWTGSLAAYARFYRQRIDKHDQREVQQYAEVIGSKVQELFPICWEALTETK